MGLEIVEITISLEQKLGIDIPDEAFPLRTIAEFRGYCHKQKKLSEVHLFEKHLDEYSEDIVDDEVYKIWKKEFFWLPKLKGFLRKTPYAKQYIEDVYNEVLNNDVDEIVTQVFKNVIGGKEDLKEDADLIEYYGLG